MNKEKEITTQKLLLQRALGLAKIPIIIALFITPLPIFDYCLILE